MLSMLTCLREALVPTVVVSVLKPREKKTLEAVTKRVVLTSILSLKNHTYKQIHSRY